MVFVFASIVNLPSPPVGDTSYVSPKVLFSLITFTYLTSAPVVPTGTYLSTTLPASPISTVSLTGTLILFSSVAKTFSEPN